MDEDPFQGLRQNERAALKAFLTRLQQHYAGQVLSVVLFGSKARSDSGPESDMDLLVVVQNDNWRVHRSVSHLAFEPMVEHDVLLSTHTIGQDLFTRMKRRRTPLYRAIQEEGIELWTKQPGTTSTTISG